MNLTDAEHTGFCRRRGNFASQDRNLVALAEQTRSKYASLASKAALIYAPAIHLAAATAFAVWFISTGDARVALNVAIALLIITCPCALGLAVPAVSTAASGKLFRERALLKSPTALERLASVDTVVFDKTGTLTVADTVLADSPATTLSPLPSLRHWRNLQTIRTLALWRGTRWQTA